DGARLFRSIGDQREIALPAGLFPIAHPVNPFLNSIAGAGYRPKTAHTFRHHALKRVAIFQIRLPRFRSLLFRMSLSQNRCTLLRDML
ncbi:hypothetical protein ACCT25_32625, partial [Rhizobium ruizarguesonis]